MIEDFLGKICENPLDPLYKLVYADRLEEQGEERTARAWRAVVELNIKPTNRYVQNSDGVGSTFGDLCINTTEFHYY